MIFPVFSDGKCFLSVAVVVVMTAPHVEVADPGGETNSSAVSVSVSVGVEAEG